MELLQGTLRAANPSEIPAKKCSLCQKVQVVFIRDSLTLFLGISLSETLKTRGQVSRGSFSGASGHAWTTAGSTASHRQWPLPDILVSQVQPFSSLQAFLFNSKKNQ